MLSRSVVMQQLIAQAERFARSSATVLILGESGVGKDLFARLIHDKSPQSTQTYARVNCAALSESLIESELFGHEAGAFTGAARLRRGRLEAVGHGTLLLDEVGELALATQAKLLRVLEEREYERVGSNDTLSFSGRVIAATNRNLPNDVESGRFRLDLLHRLNVLKLTIPPLRKRPEDIRPLAQSFLAKYSCESPYQPQSFSDLAWQYLEQHQWPGNVRELRNIVQRGCVLATSAIIDLPELLTPDDADQFEEVSRTPAVPCTLEAIERQTILDRLRVFHGNQTQAAEALGVTSRTLRNKLRRYRTENRNVG